VSTAPSPIGAAGRLQIRLAGAAAGAFPGLDLSEVDQATGPDGFPCTDYGNAQRFVQDHGEEIRFVPRWNARMEWDGRRLTRDSTLSWERRAKATLRGCLIAAAALPDKDKDQLVRHAQRSESRQGIANMLELAKSEAEIVIRHDDLDADPWLLNVLNGTLDLRTGVLRPHHVSDLITKLAPVEFDPTAKAPQFLRFLTRVLAGDEETIRFLQRFIGYCLTGDTREQVLLFLHGLGANGKSTLIEAIRWMLGDLAKTMDFSTLTIRKQEGGPRPDLAALVGARAAIASEVEDGSRLAEVVVKQLTGGEVISCRSLYQEPFEFRPTFKVLLAANHRPAIRGTDLAIWRRVCMVPFSVTIPENERDAELPQKLRAELPGILNWALEGCRAWQSGGLAPPASVRAATDEYRQSMDTLGAFIAERCSTAFADGNAGASDLFRAYDSWAKENGEHALGSRKFGEKLLEKGFRREHTARGNRYFGIMLKDREGFEASSGNFPHAPYARGS
jgi:putative DNA primase/helicase